MYLDFEPVEPALRENVTMSTDAAMEQKACMNKA